MDKLIATFENYSICQLSKEHLLSLSKFVVDENYKHHENTLIDPLKRRKEILAIYKEELQYFSKSKIGRASCRERV